MAKKASKVRNDPGESVKPDPVEKKLDRSDELLGNKDVKEALLDIYKDIEKGFQEQADRSDDNMDYWDCYNNVLNGNQFYEGNSRIFVPIVNNAVGARKTRFVNQMFPMSGRYVEATTEDGNLPQTEMALLEHYVRTAKLRTQVAPALVKSGDIEGQYTIQVTWRESERHVVRRVKKPPEIDEGVTGAASSRWSIAPGRSSRSTASAASVWPILRGRIAFSAASATPTGPTAST